MIIIVKITMNAIPEKRREILQTLLSMTAAIRQEKGCRSCQVFQDVENENFFSLFEEWGAHDALGHHIRSEIFSVLLGSRILLCGNPEIQIHTVSHTKGSGFVNAVRGKKNLLRSSHDTSETSFQPT